MDPNAQARPGLIIMVLVALAAISILGVAAVIGVSILRPILSPARGPAGISVAARVTDAPTPTTTSAPTATIANTPTITDVPTVTAVPPTATNTSTPTNTLTPTNTPTITPTDTPGPPTETPTATKKPTKVPPPTSAAGRCVAVVGDSVAHGDAVYEIPGVGFLQAQLLPLSSYIDQDFKARGTSDMKVFNRSSSAVGISTSNHPSYFSTGEYAQLLNDGCKYVAIIPWINDLSSGTDAGSAAGAHVAALSTLVQAILGRVRAAILIVNYYAGAVAPFALSGFAQGFTSGNVAVFNQQIAAACSGGALANPQVLCVDAGSVFGGMGFSYLIGPANHQDVSQMGIASPDQQNQVNFYFSSHPDGQLTGDGVHLSNAGKSALASYLVGQMQ